MNESLLKDLCGGDTLTGQLPGGHPAGDVHAAGNPHIQTDPHNIARVADALAHYPEDMYAVPVAAREGTSLASRDAVWRGFQQGMPLKGIPQTPGGQSKSS